MRQRLSITVFIFLSVITSTDSWAQLSSVYKVTRQSFNYPAFSEISPVIIKDGMIFCSDRRTSGIIERTSFDNRRLYNIYAAQRKDTSGWGKVIEIKSERSGLFNIGPFCIAPDGKTVYFTSETETGIPSKNRKFRNHSGIFTAELAGTELKSLQPFKYNNPFYDLGQPSISGDGRYLYFVSDMPGGIGGSDIYYCESVNGEWKTPVNAGPKVNSPGIENYPFIHKSGRLYFSSDRPGGEGGLDVYYTVNNSGSWSDPVRLADPINSPADDFAFTASEDLLKGYFSSNRRRNDDIYEFTTLLIRKSSCDSLEQNSYCYEFVEENAIKVDSIPFTYQWNFGDGTKSEGRKVDHCYPGPGRYLVQLDVINLVTKEILINEKSSVLEIQNLEQPYISCPDMAFSGDQIKFSADSTNLPGRDIIQYYWSFEDETIALGKNVLKSYYFPGTYKIQLIVSSKQGTGGPVKEFCVSKNILIRGKP